MDWKDNLWKEYRISKKKKKNTWNNLNKKHEGNICFSK